MTASLSAVSTTWAGAYVVRNNNDSGSGSLRQAILDSNAGGGGTITFSNVTGLLSLQSSLPSLTASVDISGPGAAQLTVVHLGGSVLTNFAGNTATISGLTLAAQYAEAPILYNAGAFTLSDSLICSNTAIASPGLENAGTMTLNSCAIFLNYNEEGGAGGIRNSGTLNLNSCAVTNNVGNGYGSGIYNSGNLTMDNSVVAGNWYNNASGGGGIYSAAGTVVLRNCSVTNNTAVDGGGIWNAGSLAITNCTLAQNRGNYSTGPATGGGLYNGGTAELVNTTVSENSALDFGGGIWNSGTLSLLNSTIASNVAHLDIPAGGGVWNGGTVYSRNSVFAGNTAVDGPDFYGPLVSQGYNLFSTTPTNSISGDTSGNLYGVDPRLGPLQDNGGPTFTHALLPGSPAIDSGTSAGAPPFDQRGHPRPQGLGFDIGAFEADFPPAVFTKVAAQSGANVALSISGLPGALCVLYASTDLVSWAYVTNLYLDSNGLAQWEQPAVPPQRFFRLSQQPSRTKVQFDAASGEVQPPFVIVSNYVSQGVTTTGTDGGHAKYVFVAPYTGTYLLQALVSAPNTDSNSFFIDIDEEPDASASIWDVNPPTTGFESRFVSWRGSGSATNDEFVPKVFYLTQGPHQLIVRGREAGTLLQSVTVISAIYLPASSASLSPPFILANNSIYQTIDTLNPADGGRAVFNFSIGSAGNYSIQGLVQATDESSNSFFFNLGQEPQDPFMIWDITPFTAGFDFRPASWRGYGTYALDQFVPVVFSLGTGNQQVILRGREANTQLQGLLVLPYP